MAFCAKIELGMCPINAIQLHIPVNWVNCIIQLKCKITFDPKEAVDVGRNLSAHVRKTAGQEKSYRAFGNELGRDATPLEADLPRFIDLNKEFHGKAEMEQIGVRSKCVTLLIDGPTDADPWGREALYTEDGTRVGRLTSGGYSVVFGKSIGMGYVKPEHAVVGRKLKVKILNDLWDAEITQDSPYDPRNVVVRADF